MPRLFFSLNESSLSGHVHKDSPQDSSTMNSPWTQQRRPYLFHRSILSPPLSLESLSFFLPLSPIPLPLYFRRTTYHHLSVSIVLGVQSAFSPGSRRNFVLNFVLRRLRARQSPISRPTEIQFKPLITTETAPPPSTLIRVLHPLVCADGHPSSPRHILSLFRLLSIHHRPFTPSPLPTSHFSGPLYFSNLKSYLLISYVSPLRLGDFYGNR